MSTIVVGPFTISHTDDASYRAWVSHCKTVLDGVNPAMFTQTADTGQLNPATITRPATNVRTDYLIYKFDDGLGFAPVYIKFFFGTASSANQPICTITVGSATDGAGNFVGATITPAQAGGGSSASSSSSYACVTEGQVAISFLPEAFSSIWPFFGGFISRFTDAAGSPTNEGINVFAAVGSGGFSIISTLYSPAWSGSTNAMGNLYVNPFGVTSMIYQGAIQPNPVFYRAPHPRIFHNLAHVIKADVSTGAEFQAAMVGSTKRNFKNIGMVASSENRFACLWE